MGIEAILIASATISVGSTLEAKKEAKRSARAQSRIQSEQRASNLSQQMAERRQQIREERVRRARILQAAENTGTGGSSGEAGALGSLSTQLGANIGTNLGKIQTAENISIFAQQAANAQAGMQQAQLNNQLAQTIFGSTTQLAQAGAFDSIFKTEPVVHPSTVGMST